MNKVSMKKYRIGFLALVLGVASVASAQSMMNSVAPSQDNHAKEEEAKGKELLGKLQANQIKCADLSDDNFDSIGEYFMGLMHGDSHDAMNARITQMMGEEGEVQMHVAMGKRMSGCDPLAAYPMGDNNMMPMMGGQQNMGADNNFYGRMMSGRYMQSDGIEFLSTIVWWGVLIVMMVMLYRLVSGHRSAVRGHSSPMEVLKERYAKGEIDKEEFHDKKKDLV